MADAKWDEINKLAGELWLDSGGQPTTKAEEEAIWRQAEQLVDEAATGQAPETVVEGDVFVVEENVIEKPKDVTVY